MSEPANRQCGNQPDAEQTQTQPKFTPGPWNCGPYSITGPRTPSVSGHTVAEHMARSSGDYKYRNSAVVHVGHDSVAVAIGSDAEEADANAHLIAAAPEMLEALKHITDEMELADFDPEDQDTWYGRALAIIAKAEGRSL